MRGSVVNLVRSGVMMLAAAVVCMAHLASREQWLEVDESVSLVVGEEFREVSSVESGTAGDSALDWVGADDGEGKSVGH